eukprot:745829-Hanusia_phi.AAC.5
MQRVVGCVCLHGADEAWKESSTLTEDANAQHKSHLEDEGCTQDPHGPEGWVGSIRASASVSPPVDRSTGQSSRSTITRHALLQYSDIVPALLKQRESQIYSARRRMLLVASYQSAGRLKDVVKSPWSRHVSRKRISQEAPSPPPWVLNASNGVNSGAAQGLGNGEHLS